MSVVCFYLRGLIVSLYLHTMERFAILMAKYFSILYNRVVSEPGEGSKGQVYQRIAYNIVTYSRQKRGQETRAETLFLKIKKMNLSLF